ncbi:hypothetical protein GO496_04535 [Acidovorax citrulli]|nr:hypothetical protein [Paracidovorax citrulli]
MWRKKRRANPLWKLHRRLRRRCWQRNHRKRIFSYGDGGLSIEAVDFHDAALASRLTYEFGEALHVTVQWRSSRAMQRVACVICIYGMDGRCISQVVSPQFSTDNRKTAGELSASFSPVMIGAGEYVVSVGFLKIWKKA